MVRSSCGETPHDDAGFYVSEVIFVSVLKTDLIAKSCFQDHNIAVGFF